jgi:hypothetical protein
MSLKLQKYNVNITFQFSVPYREQNRGYHIYEIYFLLLPIYTVTTAVNVMCKYLVDKSEENMWTKVG